MSNDENHNDENHNDENQNDENHNDDIVFLSTSTAIDNNCDTKDSCTDESYEKGKPDSHATAAATSNTVRTDDDNGNKNSLQCSRIRFSKIEKRKTVNGKEVITYPFLETSSKKDIIYLQNLIALTPYRAGYGNTNDAWEMLCTKLQQTTDTNGKLVFTSPVRVRLFNFRFKEYLSFAKNYDPTTSATGSDDDNNNKNKNKNNKQDASLIIELCMQLYKDYTLYQLTKDNCASTKKGDTNKKRELGTVQTLDILPNDSSIQNLKECENNNILEIDIGQRQRAAAAAAGEILNDKTVQNLDECENNNNADINEHHPKDTVRNLEEECDNNKLGMVIQVPDDEHQNDSVRNLEKWGGSELENENMDDNNNKNDNNNNKRNSRHSKEKKRAKKQQSNFTSIMNGYNSLIQLSALREGRLKLKEENRKQELKNRAEELKLLKYLTDIEKKNNKKRRHHDTPTTATSNNNDDDDDSTTSLNDT